MSEAAAIRSGVERGDPFAYVRNRPMAGRVDTRQRVGAPGLASLPAGADEPVSDDPGYAAAQLGVVVADADGQDADAMEHERESRLSRWQRLP